MPRTLLSNGTKVTRAEIVTALRARDGDDCQYPGQAHPLNFSIIQGPQEPTIDHWFPQRYGKEMGWTYEEVWDLDNLKIMCKKHNAAKGDRLPNEDDTLPERLGSNFRFRRHRRGTRPDGPCVDCNNGHDLFVGEICASCGCDAQRFPMSAKVKFPDCDHRLSWCWICSITPEMRPAAVETAVLQSESGEW